MSGLALSSVVSRLNKLAPLSLAESWDNVGLLVEPSGEKIVKRVLLTNDLTQAVMNQAIDSSTDLILSYHPPIFSSMKRLTTKSWKEKLVIQCIENRIAVYSPHTCWDAVKGGVNDWLVSAFGSNIQETRPITATLAKEPPNRCTHMITIPIGFDSQGKHELRELLRVTAEASDAHLEESVATSDGIEHVTVLCPEKVLSSILEVIQNHELTSEMKGVRIVKLEKNTLPGVGMGRYVTLTNPTAIEDLIPGLKYHLGVDTLRIGLGCEHELGSLVKTIALCAGSGSSVINNSGADILFTGEMSHHLVMDAQHRGSTVILAEHSHTERGFLRHFSPKLTELFENKVEVLVSGCDKDPLIYV